jgi:hypothetical protein
MTLSITKQRVMRAIRVLITEERGVQNHERLFVKGNGQVPTPQQRYRGTPFGTTSCWPEGD